MVEAPRRGWGQGLYRWKAMVFYQLILVIHGISTVSPSQARSARVCAPNSLMFVNAAIAHHQNPRLRPIFTLCNTKLALPTNVRKLRARYSTT